MTPNVMENKDNNTTSGTGGVDCILDIMSKDVPTNSCRSLDPIYPVADALDKPPKFDPKLGFNYTCFQGPGGGPRVGNVNYTICSRKVMVQRNVNLTVARADIWWYCGGHRVRGVLPLNWTGLCILTSFIMPVQVTPISSQNMRNFPSLWNNLKQYHRLKRSTHTNLDGILGSSPVYFDAIDQPRNIPSKFKLANEVAAGFESIPVISAIFPITPSKNTERINYVHYNVQRLVNFTRDAVEATHEQMAATSLTAYQNRVALDFLLAEKGGVCSMFQDTCCTFIPNNTAPDGSLTKALEGLRALSVEMKESSGINTWFEDWLEKTFGKWRAMAVTFFMSAAVFLAILVVCGCCGVPCIRTLCVRFIDHTISNGVSSGNYILIPQKGPEMLVEEDLLYEAAL